MRNAGMYRIPPLTASSPAASFPSHQLIDPKVVYTAIYVLPLYISPASRPSPTLSRDDPVVIRTRITSVLCSTALCSVLTYVILARLPDGALPFSPLHAMGYWPLGIVESAACLALTAILFAAPLYETLLIDGGWEDWRAFGALVRVWTQWTTWRNIVMVCGISPVALLGFDKILTWTQGASDRRDAVPLRFCPIAPLRSHVVDPDHLLVPRHLWARPRPPFLRVPHHPPQGAPRGRRSPFCHSVCLHVSIRRLCHVPLFAVGKLVSHRVGTRILQRNGPPSFLGRRRALLARSWTQHTSQWLEVDSYLLCAFVRRCLLLVERLAALD